MPELRTEFKEPAAAAEPAGELLAVAPLPAATLARRKRLIRYGGLFTTLLALGMSAIPGPKGSSDTVISVSENGASTQVHQFFFSRHIGLPFATGRADYNDDGTVKNVNIDGKGFLGNFGVALAIVIGASIFIGRRRRDD